jgi:hypothetical protein
MTSRFFVFVVLALAALSFTGCSSSSAAGSDRYSSPAGGYDDKGFPLDANGDVSSNPEDYRKVVCESGMVDDYPDFEEECR